MVLSAENKKQFWVPAGFGHGFMVLSTEAEFLYRTTDYWAPEYERSIIWNDPTIGIAWPDSCTPILSEKDRRAVTLAEAELYE